MRILITGGAGFIGINTARYFLDKKSEVTILDNFSRFGAKKNVEWLSSIYKKNLKVIKGDLRVDLDLLRKIVKTVDVIIHLAGQVAVTTSVVNPREDFEINATGTFNLLEAVRLSKNKPIIIYSSTNKVYGGLDNLKIKETKTRYEFIGLPYGVSEEQNLDFHSPYGCSKGAADQYVRDYFRIYDIPTVVMRQSCIYGERQFGMEDQGWVAWFMIALMQNRKITIYGNGKQVRDLLYVQDLVRAYDLAIKNIKKTQGHVYNIGGGNKNTLSVWYEFEPILENLYGRKIKAEFSSIRPGDQPIYISDIRKAKKDFHWKPEISLNIGIKNLYNFISENKKIFPG